MNHAFTPEVPVPVEALARSVRFSRAEQVHARNAYLHALKRGSSSAHLGMLRGRWQGADDAAALLQWLLTYLPDDVRAHIEEHAGDD